MKNTSLSVLIVEDELSFALELELLVEKSGCQVVARVDNDTAAMAVISSAQVDLILMDVGINGSLSGIELGQRIAMLNIPILYITCFGDEERFAAAQLSNVIGYVIKPVDAYTLRTAIDLAIRNTRLKLYLPEPVVDHEAHLFISHNGTSQKVAVKEVVLVEGADDYTKLWTRSKQFYLLRTTLNAMEKRLPEATFFRSHRSYIINLMMIESIDFSLRELSIWDRKIPISRKKKKQLEERINRIN